MKKTHKPRPTRSSPLLAFLIVSTLAACGTSQPQNVVGLSEVVGDDLAGVKGLTVEDQNGIDLTMARLCRVEVMNEAACDLHTASSLERRRALVEPVSGSDTGTAPGV